MDQASSLVARAHAALARVDGERAKELDRAWHRRPWTVGIALGDGSTRAALFDQLYGDKALGTFERVPGGPALRVRRGPRARFRAQRVDGRKEEHALGEPSEDPRVFATRVADAREALSGAERTNEIALHQVPLALRERPAWWQIWLWIVRWFSGRRYVPKLADARKTQSKVDEARQVLAAAEKEAAEAGQRARDLEIHYTESLRALATAKHVREITIDVVGGTLPEGVEIVELSAATRAAADVDAVVVADGTAMLAPAPDGTNVPIGPLQEAIAKLPQLAAHARAVKLARRTHEALTASMRAASEQLTAAEATFQARFAQLDQLRVADLDAFVQAQRLRLRPHIVASVQAVIEHAAVHLGQEQAELGKEWLAAIEVAKNNEELTATIERIELSSPQVTERIASEVRLLIANGVAGAAHDLQAELIAAVRPYGLPEEDAKTARFAVPHVDILPMFSGKQSKLGSAGQWLTGLFRSFETKRTETHAKVKAWIEQLRALANAEVLDAEPKLHAAMADAIGDELVRLLGRQATWLSAQQGVVRDTVLSERKKLEPLAARRDHAQRGRDELAGELSRTEAEQPAVAAAAAAAVAA